MDTRKQLDRNLLMQPFALAGQPDAELEHARQIARTHVQVANGISVLSDMQLGKSYLFYGALAAQLGIQQQQHTINSIWEDELLANVYTDDLQQKYQLELSYFKFLNTIEAPLRKHYNVITGLRIRTTKGHTVLVKHRLLYIAATANGHARLALCLYERIYDPVPVSLPTGYIVNTQTGTIVNTAGDEYRIVLSTREQQILKLIREGHSSKELAHLLKLSQHTIHRHRQNILQKLNVGNAMEACRIAEMAGLFNT